jgi:hypothetical protein
MENAKMKLSGDFRFRNRLPDYKSGNVSSGNTIAAQRGGATGVINRVACGRGLSKCDAFRQTTRSIIQNLKFKIQNYLSAVLFLCSGSMFAQQQQIVAQEEVPVSIQYIFPEFTAGRVLYKNGVSAEGKLNYNMLLEEMMFVDDANRQMVMDNVKEVNMVTIDGRRFYPYGSQKFAEELTGGAVRLRVLRRGSLMKHSKEAGYGSSSATSAIDSYSSISGAANQKAALTEKGNVLVTVSRIYYLVSSGGKYTAVKNQKTFIRQFPTFKTEIENFTKDQSVDFANQKDLISLLAYCNALLQSKQ